MENKNRITISLKEIYPIIKEKIESNGIVRLPITGTSMLPLLVWDRDSVEIVKCHKPEKCDIIFYRRDDGQFVLHRIVGKDENGYILCGDNQWVKEYNIQNRHIIGVVSSIIRKNKQFAVTKLSYRIYSKLWVGILPIRRYVLVASRKIKGMFK